MAEIWRHVQRRHIGTSVSNFQVPVTYMHPIAITLPALNRMRPSADTVMTMRSSLKYHWLAMISFSLLERDDVILNGRRDLAALQWQGFYHGFSSVTQIHQLLRLHNGNGFIVILSKDTNTLIPFAGWFNIPIAATRDVTDVIFSEAIWCTAQ